MILIISNLLYLISQILFPNTEDVVQNFHKLVPFVVKSVCLDTNFEGVKRSNFKKTKI